MKKVAVVWVSILMFTFAAWSQSQKQNQENSKANESQNQNQAQYLTDPQIAQMLKEINQADIDAAQLAQKKTKSNSIKTLAQQVEKDHKGLDLAETNLLKRLKMAPTESEGSRAFKDNMSMDLEKLKKLEGVDFDNAYLNREVTFHQRAKDLVDRSLLPNVKDTGLKELLSKTETVLTNHLQHVQTIQKSPHK